MSKKQGTRAGEAGFTILELTMAMALITLGLVALLAVLPHLISLTRMARESQVAVSAARSKLDEMRALPFPNPADPTAPNVLSAYTDPANTSFPASGLTLPAGRSAHGEVKLLSEAEAAAALSIKLDLDLDGKDDETEAPNAAFVAFPARVSVLWSDESSAPRSVTLTTVIYNQNR